MPAYSWKETYLIFYSVNKDKSIDAHYAAPIIKFNIDSEEFYGVKASIRWGIKVPPNATHYGIVDISNDANPQWIVKSELMSPSTVALFKYKGHYVIFKRALKNMKMHIYRTASVNYKELNA